MGSTKVSWADDVEANYDTTFTPDQAANIISAAFLHYKVRKLAWAWQPVKARKNSTLLKVSVSRHKRAAERAASKHAQDEYHVKFSNAFAALAGVMEPKPVTQWQGPLASAALAKGVGLEPPKIARMRSCCA